MYAELAPQGQRISIQRLAKAAHVRKDVASEFLHLLREKEGHDAA